MSWLGLAWLGYWFKDGSAQSTNNASRDTVGRTARRPHIPHVNISVTIQHRLGVCELWLYFYRRTLSRRTDDIFIAQWPIRRSLCSAQSGDKKMQITTFLSTPKFQKKCPLIWFQIENYPYVTLLLWCDKIFMPKFGIRYQWLWHISTA